MTELKENAAFVRCIDFMARMIEKYGNDIIEAKNEIECDNNIAS